MRSSSYNGNKRVKTSNEDKEDEVKTSYSSSSSTDNTNSSSSYSENTFSPVLFSSTHSSPIPSLSPLSQASTPMSAHSPIAIRPSSSLFSSPSQEINLLHVTQRRLESLTNKLYGTPSSLDNDDSFSQAPTPIMSTTSDAPTQPDTHTPFELDESSTQRSLSR